MNFHSMLEPESFSDLPDEGSSEVFPYPGPLSLGFDSSLQCILCPYTQACLWGREAVASVLLELGKGCQPATGVGCAPEKFTQVFSPFL